MGFLIVIAAVIGFDLENAPRFEDYDEVAYERAHVLLSSMLRNRFGIMDRLPGRYTFVAVPDYPYRDVKELRLMVWPEKGLVERLVPLDRSYFRQLYELVLADPGAKTQAIHQHVKSDFKRYHISQCQDLDGAIAQFVESFSLPRDDGLAERHAGQFFQYGYAEFSRKVRYTTQYLSDPVVMAAQNLDMVVSMCSPNIPLDRAEYE